MQLPLEDITNLKCWLSLLPSPPLDARGINDERQVSPLLISRLATAVKEVVMNISCIDCSGPQMSTFPFLLQRPDAIDDMTRVANDVMGLVEKLVEGDYLRVVLDRLVNDAAKQCRSSSQYDAKWVAPVYQPFSRVRQPHDITFLVSVVIAAVSFVAGLALFSIILKQIVMRRHRQWLDSLSSQRAGDVFSMQQKKQERDTRINVAARSLFLSPSIPILVRFGVPLIVLGNIAFFLSGHLNLGGSITIVLSLAGESYVADNFFEFSIASAAVEVWGAGGKEIAILVLIFSGIWPYAKQLITLTVWFLPPSVLSVSRRGSILLWLDFLAKWSFMDVFLLVLTLVGFRVSVQSPDVAFLPNDFYGIDLLLVPMWGLYANMIAQLISQVSSHFIIHYHRKSVEVAEKSLGEDTGNAMAMTLTGLASDERSDDESYTISPVTREPTEEQMKSVDVDEPEKLRNHSFSRPDQSDHTQFTTSPWVSYAFVVLLLAVIVLAVIGSVTPVYSVENLGIVGIMVESGQRFEEAHWDFSLFKTVSKLMEQAEFTGKTEDFIGLGVLSSLTILCVMVVPIVQSLTVAYMWFMPMTSQRRWRFLVAAETIGAWQYSEVFLATLVVTCW